MKKRLVLLVAMTALVIGGVIAFCADEIKTTLQLDVEKGQLESIIKPGRVEIDMSGDAISDIVQAFTSTSTDLVTIASSVATNGVTVFWNLNAYASNSIDLGRLVGGTFYSFQRIEGSEINLLRLHPTNDIYGTAVNADANLRTIAVED